MNKIKVGVVSLGCDKNRVDTETMLAKIAEKGYDIVSDPSEADVIVVNTCAFIEPARKEAVDTIFEMNSYKKSGLKKLVVAGCMGELYGKELFDELPEADAVCGTNFASVADVIEKTLAGERVFSASDKTGCMSLSERVLSTPSHFAYLKIADGCDNYCSYCLIPKIRGRYRSAPLDELAAEAEKLARGGVSELILVAQDVTKYGADLYGKKSLVPLLRRLVAIDGLRRVRLMYCYPELIDDELLDFIVSEDKICNYLDIPLQHVDSGILKLMNRKSDYESVCALFDKLRDKYPQIAVRSTFICGFPTETQAQHEKVREFLKKYRLHNVGFFAYSREEGTPAAKMSGQISEAEKKRRVADLYKTQSAVACEINRGYVGKTIGCLVDKDGLGRAEFQAPDVDGIVKISSDRRLHSGEYVQVYINSFDKYDLIGEAK